MTTDAIRSIPGVCEVLDLRGAEAGDRAPDLLFEVPHGATRVAHFTALQTELKGAFPDDLRDFFFVNTDVGAPEVARAAAERFVADSPRRRALVVSSSIPRTFVDCNRVIDADEAPRASAAGEATPGLHVYVQDPDDRRLLLGRHRAYVGAAGAAYQDVCGRGGLAIMVHSYAPRGLDVPVDERIVERLRSEYQPGRIEAWPLRPEVDLIADQPDGERMASPALVESCVGAFAAAGLGVEICGTYHLHPGSLAHEFARAFPDRTLCLEVRRDLLVETFTPFREMIPDDALVARVAGPLAEAAATALRSGGGLAPA